MEETVELEKLRLAARRAKELRLLFEFHLREAQDEKD